MSTLRELAARVGARAVGAHELVAESLRRIEALDPDLGAVVALRAQEALDEARTLDDLLARGGDAGPLAGLPALIKDNTDVAGMRTTFGSLAFAQAAPAARDARVTARLRAAGAIVVGKTNLPEFATEGYTSNLLFGSTGNPWRRERTPGGSSGGSAAALAAGLAALATATDGGGSIRIPAAYCGLAGLKPTNGVIGRDGAPDWIDFSTDGPFSAHVEDLGLLLDVVRGPGPGDPTALPAWSGPAPDGPPARLVAVERFSDHGPLAPEVAEPFGRAVERFAEVFGLPVERVTPGELFPGGSIADDWLTIAPVEHAHALGREWIEAHADELHPAARSFLEVGLAVSAEAYVAARRRRFDHVRALDERLGDDGLLLSPVMTVDACPADGGGRGSPADWYCSDAQNVTGHPALSLPAGFHESGVPFGLQVTGPRFRDDLLLRVAARWEEAAPWPLVAPGYEAFGG
jgi:Asp-tRNA(Asn)/Glu-tRNA(Gln) amidotransferase A subunit family amidase